MQVIAKATGFYPDTLRKPGDVFEVPEGVTGHWFEPVGGAEPEQSKPQAAQRAPAGKKAKSSEPQTFSEITAKDSADQTPKGADPDTAAGLV
jgi:hypothetical protein